MPSECPRKGAERRAAPLRTRPAAVSSSPAPRLRFVDPRSGSSLAPRHWGDAASGKRLPWEPRPQPAAERTAPSVGRRACAAPESGFWDLADTCGQRPEEGALWLGLLRFSISFN